MRNYLRKTLFGVRSILVETLEKTTVMSICYEATNFLAKSAAEAALEA